MILKATKLLMMLLILALPLSSFAAPFTETIHNDWFFLGDFHTYDYASHVDLERTWIGNYSQIPAQLDWSHTLPEGFEVPPYEVTRARLWIDACFVNSDNNLVEIEGMMEWDALNNRWLDNSIFNLADIDQPGFWNDGIIDVSVLGGEYSLRLDRAVFVMDYSAPTHAPEPATLILFGLGLAGIGINFKRRKK